MSTRIVRVYLFAAAAVAALASGCNGLAAIQAGLRRGSGTCTQRRVETYTAMYSMSGLLWNLDHLSCRPSTRAATSPRWVHLDEWQLQVRQQHRGLRQPVGGRHDNIGADAFDYEDERCALRLGGRSACAARRVAGAMTCRPDVSRSFWARACCWPRARPTATPGAAACRRSARPGAARRWPSWASASSPPAPSCSSPTRRPRPAPTPACRAWGSNWARPQMGKAGLSWFRVPRSTAIYPGDLAPLVFIEKGREGLTPGTAGSTSLGWYRACQPPGFACRVRPAAQRHHARQRPE